MKYRPRWILLGMGAVAVALLFTFPLWRTMLRGRTTTRPFALAEEPQREVLLRMPDRNKAATAYAALLTPAPVPTNQQPPTPGNAEVLRTGTFAQLDALHRAEGDVTLFRLAGGNIVLRFENFKGTNAPDLAVYLSVMEAPRTKQDLSAEGPEFRVGSLLGNSGNQQFNIPQQLRLDRYRSVVLYSEGLEAVYSTARLR